VPAEAALSPGPLTGPDASSVDGHADGAVAGPGHRGVHAPQVEVCLTAGRGLSDHRLQRHLEDPGLDPEMESSVGGGPGTVPLGHVPHRTVRTEPRIRTASLAGLLGGESALRGLEDRLRGGGDGEHDLDRVAEEQLLLLVNVVVNRYGSRRRTLAITTTPRPAST